MTSSMPPTASTAGCFVANEKRLSDVLAEFAAACGEARAAAASRPIQLQDAGVVWFVERGAIDVLAAEYADGQMQSPFRHVVRLQQGRLAFGAGEADHALRLVAKGLQASSLRRLPLDLLIEELRRRDDADLLGRALRAQVDAWIEDLGTAVVREMEERPRTEHRLHPGSAPGNGIVTTDSGVVWAVADDLDATFLDLIDARDDGPGMMPATRDAWIRLHSTAGVSGVSTAEFDVTTLLTSALPEFHRLALGAESMHRRLLLVDDANLQVAQASQRRRDKALARRNLSTLPDAGHAAAMDGTALGSALRMIGAHEGIRFSTPTLADGAEPSLNDYCEASGVRSRGVRLLAEDRWYLGDSGAMLAFRRDDDHPVVLVPGRTGRYRVVDPATGKSTPASAGTTDEIYDARLLYPRLHTESATGLRELFRVGGAKAAAEAGRLVAVGLGAGLLGLAPAVAVDRLIGTILPAGDAALLIQFSAVLVGLAFVAAAAHILRGTALMRLEGRLAARLGAAVSDRLLRLRSDFFRRFTAGELTARSMVFQEVRDHVSGVTADAVLSTLFVLPAFGLLFFHSAALGWAMVLLGVVVLGTTAAFCILNIEPQRRHLETTRRLASDMHQFLNGIAKLRVTGAEDSAFAAWAQRYREHKQAEIRISILTERLTAFSAGVPALASAVLFAVVAAQGPGGLPAAGFVAAHIAAMVFCMSIVMLGNSARAVAFIKPACEQMLPILASPVDADARRGIRPTLEGEILLDKVSFSYSEGGPKILQEVSIHAKPGEFIAIVGESGSGKSTLLRLALGLERPSSGAVYYDSQDLSHLNVSAVRRQIGVVMQGGSLQAGTILVNVIGAGNELNEVDAWRAARQAAVDQDIRDMPMGLYTTVGEHAATFSGGQGQRIGLAAALVRDPRIVFLDEPTSWLDTKSQAKTMKAIEQSTSTRFVIAHRLSTIRRANRIYVMRAGRVVQVGSFDDLHNVDGPFRDLAVRQMA